MPVGLTLLLVDVDIKTCEPVESKFMNFNYSVHVETFKQDEPEEEEPSKHPQPKSNLTDYQITIKSPFVIENLLAKNLNFQVSYHKFSSKFQEISNNFPRLWTENLVLC